jgi:hypothetical protein
VVCYAFQKRGRCVLICLAFEKKHIPVKCRFGRHSYSSADSRTMSRPIRTAHFFFLYVQCPVFLHGDDKLIFAVNGSRKHPCTCLHHSAGTSRISSIIRSVPNPVEESFLPPRVFSLCPRLTTTLQGCFGNDVMHSQFHTLPHN